MFKQAISLFAVLALAGCAVPFDEEGDENVDAAEEAVTGTNCSSPSADAKAVQAAMDSVRTKAGMSALTCNNNIRTGAIAHANYQHLNGGTHVEVSGKSGFYAANFWERMKKAGFNGPAMSEVIISGGYGPNVITGPSGWMNTVYHRVPFVSYQAKSYGFGNYGSGASSTHGTIDFSSDGAAAPTTALSYWPMNGETGVWTTFSCTSESPNPCDSGFNNVGYPLSITGGGTVVLSSHTITGGGVTIAHWYRTHAFSGYIPTSQVYLLPQTPLAKNTKYTVNLIGTVSGVPFGGSWAFTTGGI